MDNPARTLYEVLSVMREQQNKSIKDRIDATAAHFGLDQQDLLEENMRAILQISTMLDLMEKNRVDVSNYRKAYPAWRTAALLQKYSINHPEKISDNSLIQEETLWVLWALAKDFDGFNFQHLPNPYGVQEFLEALENFRDFISNHAFESPAMQDFILDKLNKLEEHLAGAHPDFTYVMQLLTSAIGLITVIKMQYSDTSLWEKTTSFVTTHVIKFATTKAGDFVLQKGLDALPNLIGM